MWNYLVDKLLQFHLVFAREIEEVECFDSMCGYSVEIFGIISIDKYFHSSLGYFFLQLDLVFMSTIKIIRNY